MTTKEIEKYIILLFCMFIMLVLSIVGLITGIIKIKQQVDELEKTNLQVHEYILNRIEIK